MFRRKNRGEEKQVDRREPLKRMCSAGAKGIILMMVLALVFAGITTESYGKNHEYSSVTSISGGGNYQVGDRVQVRVSYTNENGQNIAGMMARITFSKKVLAYESTILGPGSLDGYPEGYGSDLNNVSRINQSGTREEARFTLGLYNRDTVPALSATINFVVIAEGEGNVTSTIGQYERAGWVDEDGEPYFLSGSTGSISISAGEGEGEEQEDDSGDKESEDEDEPRDPGENDDSDRDEDSDRDDGGDRDDDSGSEGSSSDESREGSEEGSSDGTPQDSVSEESDEEDPPEDGDEEKKEGSAFRDFLRQADSTGGGNGNDDEDSAGRDSPEGGSGGPGENDRARTGTYLIIGVIAVLIVVLLTVLYQKQREKKKKSKGRKKRK